MSGTEEEVPLVDKDGEEIMLGRSYTEPLKGVTPDASSMSKPVMRPAKRSMNAMSDLADVEQPSGSFSNMVERSYSVSGDGSISHQTPLQMGRHELYDNIPFTAVSGLQKKTSNLSLAYSSYAADLDAKEADQIALATTKKHLSNDELEKRRSHASLLLLDELELDAVMVTTPLIFAVLVATLSQFLVGYNTGVMNAPEAHVFPGHTTGMWSFAVAAFAIGGPFGANLAGNLAETRGRRGALLINAYSFLLGGLVQTFALNMYWIIGSRFMIGFASGVSSVLVPIYLGELAPPALRGTLGTLTQFALVVGILISDFLAFPFATEDKWRLLFSVTSVVSVFQILCAPFLLESPRWLLSSNPESKKARYIIKKLRGLRYDHEVETEVNHFVSAMNAQAGSKTQSTAAGFGEMIQDKNVRLLVVSCFVLQVTQQLCGINAVFYYSTSFFEGVISSPLVGTTLVGAVNVVATYVALLLMDTTGRRTLILWSTGGMFLSCIVIVLSLLHYFSNVTALIAVNVYVTFFEIGLGPIPWLIVAEMFDAKYVATAMSASCQINWACNFIIGLVFPYLVKYLGAYSFAPFAVVLLFGFMFALIWLPETQGTTPEELQAQLIQKNASTVYHNVSFVDVPGASAASLGTEWRLAMERVRQEESAAMDEGTYNYGFKPIDSEDAAPSSQFLPST